jgi:hypothetical protein
MSGLRKGIESKFGWLRGRELVGLHYTLPISLQIAACRTWRKRPAKTPRSECIDDEVRPGDTDSFAEATEVDAIWREVMAMDVPGILDAEIQLLRQEGALKPNNTPSYPVYAAHLYGLGYGGLNLAAIEA